MATTTPNFGWPVPTSTDYVKNGATAIEGLGDAIDASLVYLKGGTTGQVLSKTSNTDLAFTWVTQDDANAIQNAIVDAKGDLIGATANDTPARIAVGTNGQVLTADSTAAAGVSWQTPSSGSLTWTQRKQPAGSAIVGFAYNGTNLYVGFGQNGILLTSPDGKTWTSRTSGFGTNTINKVAYGNGLWVAVGANGTLTTSSDGTTWTARTSNMGTNGIRDVLYANSTWVAVGIGGGTTNTGGIIYSTDGLTWTRKSQTITVGANYTGVTWNGTNWLVTSDVNTNNMLYASTPSGTWTAIAFGSGAVLIGAWYDGTRYWVQDTNAGWGWVYGTAATPAYVDILVNVDITQSGWGAANKVAYYNGKFHILNLYYYSFSTTLALTQYSSQVDQMSILPGSYTPRSATAFNVGAYSIAAFAAGILIGGSQGEIWTSF